MTVPFDIKIFDWIYESGKYLLPLLFVLWLTWLICVTILRKKGSFYVLRRLFLFIVCLVQLLPGADGITVWNCVTAMQL